MNPYNPNLHHRKSIRLKGFDYSQAGLYFVTICCFNKECLFGEIKDSIMYLNQAGKIADKCWLDIPSHFPNVILHEHIIMPNHIHGIIELDIPVGAKNISPDIIDEIDLEAKNISPDSTVENNVGAKNLSPDSSVENKVETKNNSPDLMIEHISPDKIDEINGATNLTNKNDEKDNRAKNISPLQDTFRSPSKTIGSVIRGFKIGVTKWMRQNTEIYDVWQRNYYEHIIRNQYSCELIADYIKNNPSKWNEDTFYIKK